MEPEPVHEPESDTYDAEHDLALLAEIDADLGEVERALRSIDQSS
jgi:hypothetical protein